MTKVYISSVIAAPAPEVWSAIRDFGAIADWHPAIARSVIEGSAAADQVGCVRELTTGDGGKIRERQLALSDYDMSCTYSILESPLGVENYVATLKLTPVTDGERCFAEWSAEFGCAAEREDALSDFVGNAVFQGGFDALKQRFGGR